MPYNLSFLPFKIACSICFCSARVKHSTGFSLSFGRLSLSAVYSFVSPNPRHPLVRRPHRYHLQLPRIRSNGQVLQILCRAIRKAGRGRFPICFFFPSRFVQIPAPCTKPRIRAHLAPFLHVADFGHLRRSKLPRPCI